MIRWSETSTAPTWRPRHAARSRVATARSMKYCSGVGRTAARRASARSAVGIGVGSMPAAYRGADAGVRRRRVLRGVPERAVGQAVEAPAGGRGRRVIGESRQVLQVGGCAVDLGADLGEEHPEPL